MTGCGRAIVRFHWGDEGDVVSSDTLLANPGTSEMLTLHEACPNIVYAGLRNSTILSGDFRSGKLSPIASLGHKAVVKVQRLQDSAVPFGLLASGMGNKVRTLEFKQERG
jgi:hypothetical protein